MAILKTLVLPPGALLIAAILALILHRQAPRAAPRIVVACLVGLYIFSTPLFGTWALSLLQPEYVDPRTHEGAQAIVLLGGGTAGYADEYGADTVNPLSLVRLRYAARLQRLTGLPLLVSGGSVLGDTLAEAEQIRAVLTEEMGIPVQWIETTSVDTYTNALESAKILRAANISRVLLVTHAWHVPRARLAFARTDLDAIPAPTGFVTLDWPEPGDFLPRASAVLNSYYFFHEILGYAVYAMRARL